MGHAAYGKLQVNLENREECSLTEKRELGGDVINRDHWRNWEFEVLWVFIGWDVTRQREILPSFCLVVK